MNESIQRLTRSKLSKWDPRKHVYSFRSRNAPVSLFLPLHESIVLETYTPTWSRNGHLERKRERERERGGRERERERKRSRTPDPLPRSRVIRNASLLDLCLDHYCTLLSRSRVFHATRLSFSTCRSGSVVLRMQGMFHLTFHKIHICPSDVSCRGRFVGNEYLPLYYI